MRMIRSTTTGSIFYRIMDKVYFRPSLFSFLIPLHFLNLSWWSQFCRESWISCGSWQYGQNHGPTLTTQQHMLESTHHWEPFLHFNHDAIGQFSLSALFLRPSTGFFCLFCVFCVLSPAHHHLLVDCCIWQVSWIFWFFLSVLLLDRFSILDFIFEAFKLIFCFFLIFWMFFSPASYFKKAQLRKKLM